MFCSPFSQITQTLCDINILMFYFLLAYLVLVCNLVPPASDLQYLPSTCPQPEMVHWVSALWLVWSWGRQAGRTKSLKVIEEPSVCLFTFNRAMSLLWRPWVGELKLFCNILKESYFTVFTYKTHAWSKRRIRSTGCKKQSAKFDLLKFACQWG